MIDWTVSPQLLQCALVAGLAFVAWMAGIEITELLDHWRDRDRHHR